MSCISNFIHTFCRDLFLTICSQWSVSLIWRSNIISAEWCHKNHVTSNVFITGVSPIRPWTCRILWCRILMDHQSTTWHLPMERSMLQGRYSIDQLCKKSSTKEALQHQKGMWHACFFLSPLFNSGKTSRIHRLASDFGRSSAESSDRMGWWDFFCLNRWW